MRSLARPLAVTSLLNCALLLGSCGGGDTLPSYRCVKTIDGAHETGGEVASSGSVAYVAGGSTIGVFDLSNPADPKVLPPLAFPQRVEAIAVGGGRLVAAGEQVVLSYDVADPRAPVLLGRLDTTATARNALVTDGHWAYAGTPYGGITVFDVSGGAPVFVTSSSQGSLAITDLLLDGNTLYAAGGQRISLIPYDVTKRDQPVPHTAVELNGAPESLELADGALFVSTISVEGTAAQRLDLSSPLAPTVVASRSGGCNCSAGDRTVQSTFSHGHFLVPDVAGRVVRAFPRSIDKEGDTEVGSGCIPARYSMTNVHAVGEALVITGGDVIAFLAH